MLERSFDIAILNRKSIGYNNFMPAENKQKEYWTYWDFTLLTAHSNNKPLTWKIVFIHIFQGIIFFIYCGVIFGLYPSIMEQRAEPGAISPVYINQPLIILFFFPAWFLISGIGWFIYNKFLQG